MNQGPSINGQPLQFDSIVDALGKAGSEVEVFGRCFERGDELFDPDRGDSDERGPSEAILQSAERRR